MADVEGLIEYVKRVEREGETELNLYEKNIDDAALSAISPFIGRWTNLVELRLSYNGFGDAGLSALAPHLPSSLKLLTLAKNSSITEAGYASLVEAVKALAHRRQLRLTVLYTDMELGVFDADLPPSVADANKRRKGSRCFKNEPLLEHYRANPPPSSWTPPPSRGAGSSPSPASTMADDGAITDLRAQLTSLQEELRRRDELLASQEALVDDLRRQLSQNAAQLADREAEIESLRGHSSRTLTAHRAELEERDARIEDLRRQLSEAAACS